MHEYKAMETWSLRYVLYIQSSIIGWYGVLGSVIFCLPGLFPSISPMLASSHLTRPLQCDTEREIHFIKKYWWVLRHLSAEGVLLSFFRRQLTAEGTSEVNCSRFLTSVVNCRRGIFVFYMCFSALSYVSTTILML